MVTTAQSQSATNWRNTHMHMDHTHSLTQLQPRCAKRQLCYYRIWNQIFILKIPVVNHRIKYCRNPVLDLT